MRRHLRERREALGWSQRKIAAQAGMSRTTLWRDATKPRKISAERLIRLSSALRRPLPESVARLVGSVGYEETDDARRLREAASMVDEALKGAQLAAETLAEMKALLG
ncbi:MAG: helix-turn-helix transcriptional regulator [Chloroflexi bacterium]|nr:helix-turn-helix transcriptional regulator [Chloroflexota bacterium]